jgi:hypothetical protein
MIDKRFSLHVIVCAANIVQVLLSMVASPEQVRIRFQQPLEPSS